MDTGLVDQQKGAESSASGTTLSAQQFYQHDPLLVLLVVGHRRYGRRWP